MVSRIVVQQSHKERNIRESFAPFRLNDGTKLTYGYGWHLLSSGGIKSIEHAGHLNGFTTNQIYYPEQDVFIAILFNYQDAPKDELSKRITEIVLGQPYKKTSR